MKINQPFSKEAQAYLDANPEIAEMIANCPDPGPPKRRVPGVALPVSAEMQEDIYRLWSQSFSLSIMFE
jgi:hypothetical protein